MKLVFGSRRSGATRMSPLLLRRAAGTARHGAARAPARRTGYAGRFEMSWGLWTGGFLVVSANCETFPKIYEIRGFLNFAGNAPKLSKITGQLPENLNWDSPV